ncbi:MAG: chromosome segregation protein [Ectobacillus sp.]
MEYKTPMVAKKLGVSPKVVMRIVQELDLDIQKNKFGHYVFNENDLNVIMNYYTSSSDSPSPESKQIPQYVSVEEFTASKQKIEELIVRMNRNEEKLLEKADNIVNYQLLQHRNEIEELQQKITTLEAIIEEIQSQKQHVAPIHEIAASKPKRRNMIFNIFGF